MTDDRQERIRQRAHAIWERAGRPEGSHQQHWDQATAEIDSEAAKPKAKAAPKKPAAKKPAAAKASKPKAVRSGKG
ncbi:MULTISPECIES: DUF2934 domain-containing protein [unclassified Mesorhizobium]|uniref:DUF2934 domain-containing protein n=1 Tax=unclassified Mesorhizobium TaxID=325217 RepID=UPI000FD9F653|nr:MULTISPECIES: DUF2934 domain-containing protein [unclassified Mesorhizobium]TGQ34663.1 DUF2934 domain-containing protein [Mesorhizobium sp. M00.F.Ca.ET.216.01.1.1]TIS57605.1 MAG: DUF2934 domain-containing protein [Mesorhizobium sp.]TIS88618.1 MAG: DUF2934 domain-containing protein [Mesorhizobium sp.]TJW07259.1 MAG: DUF2934 domain-containing protein [Mesorhizobium sp.]TJW34699.1 MAG: DUF2934 domain-containing protein [Mesorhizobium sp.]